MADEDIYHSKKNYGHFLATLDERIKPVGKAKYYCRNPRNLEYFRKYHAIFERKDNSYVRRLRLFRNLLLIVYHTKKDLKDLDREDVNEIVVKTNAANRTPISKATFIKDLKNIWRNLFPENDSKGRIDDSIAPYPVRHLSTKLDKSQKKLRNDKLTWEEYEQLLNYFCKDSELQFYLALAVESLGRPQEILSTRIRNIEDGEHYAKIWVEQGKEGSKFLQVIDSYPYLLKWLEKHPHKSDVNSFLFLARKRKDKRLTPFAIRKRLATACVNLGIQKNITPYSLKRNGVTFARLRGEDDVTIQHKAGWSSLAQLKTYDLSEADDSFKRQLAKKGYIQDAKYRELLPATKDCVCGESMGFAEKICPKCKRIVDRRMVMQNMKSLEEINKRSDLVLRFVEEFIMQDRETQKRLIEFRKNPRVQELLHQAGTF